MIRQEAAKIVAVVLASCPAQSSRIDAGRAVAMIDAYESLLGDLSYQQVDTAIRVLLQTSNWLPSIAEIRSAVLEVARGSKRPGGEAWGDVLAAVSRFGVYRSPVFADPVVARAISSLGWEEICNSLNQAADRARFIELYDRLAAQEQREAASPALAAARERRERNALPVGSAIRRVLDITQAALPAAPDGDTLGAKNARSEQNGPARVDFNRFLPEGNNEP